MDRRVYSAESLREGLRAFETHFGLSTEDFYERYRAGDELPSRASSGTSGRRSTRTFCASPQTTRLWIA